jgi:hypothetical protein
MNTMNLTGGCLCGGVRYELEEKPSKVADCHCIDCRRSSGAPYMTWGIVQREKFKLICGTIHRVSYAGRLRSFASCCGTQILFEDTPDWPTVDVAIATLDDPCPFPPAKAIWTEDRLPWVTLDPSIPSNSPTPPRGQAEGGT